MNVAQEIGLVFKAKEKNPNEEVKGASRTRVWGSFWSFKRSFWSFKGGDLCALRWHNLTKDYTSKVRILARISRGQEGLQFKRQQERLPEGWFVCT
ncbi:hypothetical protein BY996DRAFT_6445549 [Phakopsora pachyrhizi]|nr:hypothetical protein BY996DRAFT_6445549 [Phakopsora pachyrhizi]